VKAHCTSSSPSSYLPLAGRSDAARRRHRGRARPCGTHGVASWQSPTPASQERRRTSPQGGGMESVAALRRDMRLRCRGAAQRPGDAQSEGCGAPSGRVLFLVGSLSAPRLAASLPPLSPLTTCSAGERPADMDLESSNSGGGEEAARGGPLLRPRGLIATRSRKWLPPLAVVLERRGPTPHDRDGLGHASLMGQGWEEFNAAPEGGDKWCRGPLRAMSGSHDTNCCLK
jgi:hypothetical protein